MLCISRTILQNKLGLTEAQLNQLHELFPSTGILPCWLFSFNGGGEGRPAGKSPAEWLATEPEGNRRLCLIGMADRYGNARSAGAEIQEVEEQNLDLEPLCELLNQYGWSGKEAALALIFAAEPK